MWYSMFRDFECWIHWNWLQCPQSMKLKRTTGLQCAYSIDLSPRLDLNIQNSGSWNPLSDLNVHIFYRKLYMWANHCAHESDGTRIEIQSRTSVSILRDLSPVIRNHKETCDIASWLVCQPEFIDDGDASDSPKPFPSSQILTYCAQGWYILVRNPSLRPFGESAAHPTENQNEGHKDRSIVMRVQALAMDNVSKPRGHILNDLFTISVFFSTSFIQINWGRIWNIRLKRFLHFSSILF